MEEGGTSWGWRRLSADRLASYSLTGCSPRSRACWASLVPTECKPTTSRTWGLPYCIGEFSFHRLHVPWLLRVKADVGRLLGFPWVQIRPWSVGKGSASEDVKAMTGQDACPKPLRWGGDQSSPFRPHWKVTRTSVAVWNETHTPSNKDIPIHIHHPFPLCRPTFPFQLNLRGRELWAPGKLQQKINLDLIECLYNESVLHWK